MSPHDNTGEKLPDEKICELVFEAGYNGMAIDLGASDVKKAFELQPLMEKIGLTPLIVAFPKTINSLNDTIKMAKDLIVIIFFIFFNYSFNLFSIFK